MPRFYLGRGENQTRCPKCGGPMSDAFRGQQTQKWIRHCQDREHCGSTTLSDEPPSGIVAHGALGAYKPAALPYVTVDDVVKPVSAMATARAVARDVKRRIDQKMAAAGGDRE